MLAQSFDNFELIIVDDGSSDDTAATVGCINDSRIRFFQQTNQGQSVARNTGLGEASGEFIAFLDSDDEWCPQKLEQQLAAFDVNPEAILVYGNELFIGADGLKFIHGRQHPLTGDVSRQLVLGNFINLNTTLVRRSALPAQPVFAPEMRAGEDYDLWLRLSCKGSFAYVDEVWARYNMSGERVSDGYETVYANNERSLAMLFSQHPNRFEKSLVRNAFCLLYVRRGRARASAGRFKKAIDDYVHAFRMNWRQPLVWRAMAKLLLIRR